MIERNLTERVMVTCYGAVNPTRQKDPISGLPLFPDFAGRLQMVTQWPPRIETHTVTVIDANQAGDDDDPEFF